MKIGGTSNVNGPQGIYPRQGQSQQSAAVQKAAPLGDRVEISAAARLSEAISRVPDIRMEKVLAAKEMISAGQMDTPERMDAAIGHMLADVQSE